MRATSAGGRTRCPKSCKTGLKIVLRWSGHDSMGPTVWDDSAEFEAVEKISAEVVVHVDSVAEEA